MINTISSENLEQCIQYSYINRITTSEYASFLRFLVMTIKKELPVEVLNQENDLILKGQIEGFSINLQDGQEGEHDDLTLYLTPADGGETQEIKLVGTGKEKVSKDAKSGAKTFYRFYIYGESNEEGYRITFNRRVTKK